MLCIYAFEIYDPPSGYGQTLCKLKTEHGSHVPCGLKYHKKCPYEKIKSSKIR